MLDVEIQNEQTTTAIPYTDAITGWATCAWLGDGDAQVSLRIVDADEIQQMNRDYRGKDKATNVLSFPMDMPAELTSKVELNLLGDLVICAAVVETEANEQHKTLDSHWAHMIIHGMLHLQGYDHQTDEQAKEMETLEIKLLQQQGFDNPYQQH